jgi:hypothetical protein
VHLSHQPCTDTLHRADVLSVVAVPQIPQGVSTLFCGASVRTTPRFNLDGSDAVICLHLVRLLTSSKVLAHMHAYCVCISTGAAGTVLLWYAAAAPASYSVH